VICGSNSVSKVFCFFLRIGFLVKRFFKNFQLGSFVFNYTQTFTNLPKGNRENESFIFCDQITILRRSNEYFDGEACLKRAFLLNENIYFLRRFVWLLEEFDEFKEGICKEFF